MLTYGMEQRLDADEAKAEAEFRRFNNFLKKLGPLGRKFAKDDNE